MPERVDRLGGLRLARLRLAARGRLNVVAIVNARDAAGNRKRSLFAMTIKAS